MAKIEWVEQRLVNWARWKAGGGSGALGYGNGSAVFERVDNDRYRDSAIPVLAVDAEETDRAVKSLQLVRSDLHRTIELVYLKDMPRKDAALKMQCSVAAVSGRVDAAHRALAQWFDARRQEQQAAKQLAEARARVAVLARERDAAHRARACVEGQFAQRVVSADDD